MRIVALIVAALVCITAGAQPSDVERLKRELKVAAPPEQYPDHAEYRLFPKICNERSCFRVLAVQFVSVEGRVVRLAVFSENEHYIGSYAGLKLMPTKVDGSILHFPATAQPNQIRFDRTSPPPEIQIGTDTHPFQRPR